MDGTQNNYAEWKKPHKDYIIPFSQSSENGNWYIVTAERQWTGKGLQGMAERGMWQLLKAIDMFILLTEVMTS